MAAPKKPAPGGIVKSVRKPDGSIYEYGVNTKPAVTKGVVKPKTGQAGLYGGLGPNAYVNQLFAPQEQATQQQQASRQAAFQGLVKDFLSSLNGVGAQLAPYTAAAGQQSNDARNAAAGLAAANPNAVTQNDLRAIGAPQSQQDAVTSQNQTAFGGNAALLNYTGGVIPSDQFRSDAASRASYLAALPAIGESIGLQGLNSLNGLASKENLALAGDKTKALQTARTDLANYVQTRQKNAFDQKLSLAKYNTGIDEFNSRTTQNYDRMAQQAFQSDRSYAIAYANLGISRKNLQLKLAAQEAKLKNGGFGVKDVLKWQGEAAFGADTAFNGKVKKDSNGNAVTSNGKSVYALPPLNYKQAIREAYKHGIPLSIAVPELNKVYQPGERGRPLTDLGLDFPTSQGPTLGQAGKSTNVVNAASQFLGVPYVWGGNDPKKALDCSSFIQQTFKKLGVDLPRTTFGQVKVGKPVTLNQLQPGDVIFTRPGKNGPNHVGLYIGNGQVQESPHTGDVNKVIPIQAYLSDGFVAARRYIGG